MLLKHATALVEEGRHNQAVAACSVIPQLVQLGTNVPVDTTALRAIRATAKNMQKAAIAASGRGKTESVIPMYRVDRFIATIIDRPGGLGSISSSRVCTTQKREKEKRREKTKTNNKH